MLLKLLLSASSFDIAVSSAVWVAVEFGGWISTLTYIGLLAFADDQKMNDYIQQPKRIHATIRRVSIKGRGATDFKNKGA